MTTEVIFSPAVNKSSYLPTSLPAFFIIGFLDDIHSSWSEIKSQGSFPDD